MAVPACPPRPPGDRFEAAIFLAAPGVPPAGALNGAQVTPETASCGDPGGRLRVTGPGTGGRPRSGPGSTLHSVPEVTRDRPRTRPPATRGKQPGPATPERLQVHYADELAAGRVPSARQKKREWPVGYDRAAELHDPLKAVTETAS